MVSTPVAMASLNSLLATSSDGLPLGASLLLVGMASTLVAMASPLLLVGMASTLVAMASA